MYPHLFYQPIAKLPHPFHSSVSDTRDLELQPIDAIGAGHQTPASRQDSQTKMGTSADGDVETERDLRWRLDGPRASIRRAIEPGEVASELDSQATYTPHSSFHAIPLPSLLPITCLSLISHNMLPTFHMNNFKPWAPPTRKPFSPHKLPNPCSSGPQNLRRPKPYHNSFPITLPPSKHHLPARPPAEVCVHVSANSQRCTPLSSQFQPGEISTSEPNTYSENPKLGTPSPHGSALHVLCSDLQDDADIPIEPPSFRGDSAEDDLSSPSKSSSDDSLEEFIGLPNTQGDIPIDPVILASHEPWEDIGVQLSVPQADSLINSELACPYPDPPLISHSPPNYSRDSSERASGPNDDTQTSDHPRIHDHQLHPSQHDTGPDTSYPNCSRENYPVSGQSKSSKRKTQQSGGRARKRLRVPSVLPSMEDSFTALRSHFVSVPVGERLQFLSWLFEGALASCMSDSPLTTCDDRDARATSHSSAPHMIEPNRCDCRKAGGSSRKGMAWSREEVDLLLKLRKEEGRPWSQIARLFSEQYPGRSQGAIQVFWSTTLNKRAD